VRERLRRLARAQRFEDAARLRDRLAALEDVVGSLAELERLRELRACLLLPAAEPGFARALFVAAGRVAAARTVPTGGGARLEVAAGLAEARAATLSVGPEDGDELLVVAAFLRRPPPELAVVPLDEESIVRAVERRVALAA
jgi:DNA polymerase-3 subunit epsilon